MRTLCFRRHDSRRHSSGIALLVVMLVIIGLTVITSAFVYAMKVEMRLAQTRNADAEMEWMARSAAEFAKFVLGQQLAIASEPYDALNQKWAGGSGGVGTSNSPLASVNLADIPIGDGSVSIEIEDTERRFNINLANPLILRQALIVAGAEAVQVALIADAILDWMDADDDPRLGGAESRVYLTKSPPYEAKNGPFDDVSELMMVEGISEELFKGGKIDGANSILTANQLADKNIGFVGLKYLFTTTSSGKININTAGSDVIQMIPGLDFNSALALIRYRSGPDNLEGTEDDRQIRSVGELANVPGFAQMTQGSQIQNLFAVRSATFSVSIRCRIGGVESDYDCVIRRNSPTDLQMIRFSRSNNFLKSH